ncbi:hypothetical protein QVD17_26339 [Tagetes erecta]|uniref:Uncharacterized protein n=1 Tax=Tagetes erecta TaxID=13708 RepID=A0AAD8K6C4_TARER|nr:hypothetical protein QVD17_26339 [Tagetes erecta]
MVDGERDGGGDDGGEMDVGGGDSDGLLMVIVVNLLKVDGGVFKKMKKLSMTKKDGVCLYEKEKRGLWCVYVPLDYKISKG